MTELKITLHECERYHEKVGCCHAPAPYEVFDSTNGQSWFCKKHVTEGLLESVQGETPLNHIFAEIWNGAGNEQALEIPF